MPGRKAVHERSSIKWNFSDKNRGAECGTETTADFTTSLHRGICYSTPFPPPSSSYFHSPRINKWINNIYSVQSSFPLVRSSSSFFFFFFFLFFDPTTVSAKNKRSRVAQLEISITEIFENVAGYPASVQADTVHFHPPGTFVDEWREVVEKKNAQSKRKKE